jgi:hypothetical protein
VILPPLAFPALGHKGFTVTQQSSLFEAFVGYEENEVL